MTKMFSYYEIVSKCGEILYGSYDQAEARYELLAERNTWKQDGYTGIKLRWKAVSEAPDVGIYGKGFKPRMV